MPYRSFKLPTTGLEADGQAETAANVPPSATVATLLRAACDSLPPWPEPRIVGTPPFGADRVPHRYRRAWRELLQRCPDGVNEWQWAQAIYDARDLFETWGAEIGWSDDDIFQWPDGLVWFLRGEYVTFPGRMTAHTSGKRIWRRQCRGGR